MVPLERLRCGMARLCEVGRQSTPRLIRPIVLSLGVGVDMGGIHESAGHGTGPRW